MLPILEPSVARADAPVHVPQDAGTAVPQELVNLGRARDPAAWKTRGQRVLLTSVVKPFGEAHGDGFLTSFTGSHQILWAQDIFRLWTTANQYGLDFIAHNLLSECVTLHYPTMKQL